MKSYKNAPKLVPATVLKASWKHLGHHRAFYSKTLKGDLSFWRGLWVAFAPQGLPKASAIPFDWTFWEPFWTKNQKRSIQKDIKKLIPKKHRKSMPKGFQNDAKMETQICDCPCFLEEGESWKTVGFSNRKRGSGHTERCQYLLRIYTKTMPEWDMEKEHRKDAKHMPKWGPKSHTKWEIERKSHAKR